MDRKSHKKDAKNFRHIRRLLPSLLLCFIILVNLTSKVYFLDYPLSDPDAPINYLAVRNLIRFGEYPLSVIKYPLPPASPAYYYLMAPFLRINESILTLGVVNIILQLVTIVLLYTLGSMLFGTTVGLASAALFAFSDLAQQQSFYAYPPYVMQPVALASYVFLAVAFRTKKYRYVTASIVLFVMADAIYNSVFSILPLYGLCVYLVIRRFNQQSSRYYSAVLTFAASVAVVYTPVFLSIGFHFRELPHVSLHNLIRTFPDVTAQFLSSSLFRVNRSFPLFDLASITSIMLIFSAILAIRGWHRNSSRALLCVLLFAAIVLPITLLAASGITGGEIRRFSHVFGLAFILVSQIVIRAYSHRRMFRLAIPAIFFLLHLSSSSELPRIYRTGPALNNYQVVVNSSWAIEEEVRSIKEKQGYADFSFFQIQRLHQNPSARNAFHTPQPIILLPDTIFWPFLEGAFQTRFIQMGTDPIGKPTLLNDDAYVFLVCNTDYRPYIPAGNCVEHFQSLQPNFALEEAVIAYPRLSVYLMRRGER